MNPATTNPFATRWLRPGAVEFLFPSDWSADEACRHLEQLPAAQISGPHGSGKSTLARTLQAELLRRRWSVATCTLRHAQGRLPRELSGLLRRPAPNRALLIVDGSEQLAWWRRWSLPGRCRRAGWKLLVTTHQDCRLPTLRRLRPTIDLACQLAAQVQRRSGLPPLVLEEDVRAEFPRYGDNLRELMFALYDVYEQRRRA